MNTITLRVLASLLIVCTAAQAEPEHTFKIAVAARFRPSDSAINNGRAVVLPLHQQVGWLATIGDVGVLRFDIELRTGAIK